MDVREKLVELIKDGIRKGLRAKGNDRLDYSFEDVADHLIANGVTVQEWISVEDRVPKNSGNYLVIHRNKYNGSTSIAIEAYIKCKIGEWWSNDYVYAVTHWISLPKMPKKEE